MEEFLSEDGLPVLLTSHLQVILLIDIIELFVFQEDDAVVYQKHTIL